MLSTIHRLGGLSTYLLHASCNHWGMHVPYAWCRTGWGLYCAHVHTWETVHRQAEGQVLQPENSCIWWQCINTAGSGNASSDYGTHRAFISADTAWNVACVRDPVPCGVPSYRAVTLLDPRGQTLPQPQLHGTVMGIWCPITSLGWPKGILLDAFGM